jgi:hypothetical protein
MNTTQRSSFNPLRYLFALLLAALGSQALAAINPLLGIQTGYPNIDYRSNSTQGCSYSGGTLSLSSQPLLVTYVSGGVQSFVSSGVLTVTVSIAADGTFSGGSFNMTGIVDSFGSPLLTGTVSNYGIADLAPVGGADRIELLLTATGGSLLTSMGGSGTQVGMAVNLENSTYSGSFGSDWACGVVKGTMGPIITTPPSGGGNGTGTIGYWKNHPDAWPLTSVTLGGVTYTQAQAISILGVAVKGDKSISLAKQLIAAKLNVADGNDASCISATITAADQWLIAHGGVGSGQKQWDGGDILHDELDAYNNGELCAPHRG